MGILLTCFLWFILFMILEEENASADVFVWIALGILLFIPSHILSRHRNECCAPGFTLFGMVTGISVAVMAFGPGLFFPFARKVKEKTVAKG